ncbi:hypothetical protein [Falsiroseomonas tokyonensis]|uniref:Uncharacterized protein n=1 Tax=Falsiroseomonas tokyonensis TaxID=430521 RepID=A0ABV7C3A7_9PROT|nr:hypothetical protein [Falsiroseomonas tokyonensis]MBU8540644.1 hypothetical protein [Falsiroseomonas tokyonensis]
MARESRIEGLTANDLIPLDRARKGKKLSTAAWEGPTDPDARIARMKDRRTRLAHQTKRAEDLDTGALVAAEIHAAGHAEPRLDLPQRQRMRGTRRRSGR